MNKYLIYFKVAKTILTCNNLKQLKAADNFINNYHKRFNCNELTKALKKILKEKLTQLWDNNLTLI
jgi:hypothetical protein